MGTFSPGRTGLAPRRLLLALLHCAVASSPIAEVCSAPLERESCQPHPDTLPARGERGTSMLQKGHAVARDATRLPPRSGDSSDSSDSPEKDSTPTSPPPRRATESAGRPPPPPPPRAEAETSLLGRVLPAHVVGLWHRRAAPEEGLGLLIIFLLILTSLALLVAVAEAEAEAEVVPRASLRPLPRATLAPSPAARVTSGGITHFPERPSASKAVVQNFGQDQARGSCQERPSIIAPSSADSLASAYLARRPSIQASGQVLGAMPSQGVAARSSASHGTGPRIAYPSPTSCGGWDRPSTSFVSPPEIQEAGPPRRSSSCGPAPRGPKEAARLVVPGLSVGGLLSLSAGTRQLEDLLDERRYQADNGAVPGLGAGDLHSLSAGTRELEVILAERRRQVELNGALYETPRRATPPKALLLAKTGELDSLLERRRAHLEESAELYRTPRIWRQLVVKPRGGTGPGGELADAFARRGAQ